VQLIITRDWVDLNARSMPADAATYTSLMLLLPLLLLLLLLPCRSRELFAALDRCEEMLGQGRYLMGSAITEADVRLFMTLIRFDEVYVSNNVTASRQRQQWPAGTLPRQVHIVPWLCLNLLA
jgi:hypothetical protein